MLTLLKTEELLKAQLPLIDRINEALLKDLIDGLRASNPPILTPRETNEILQGHQVMEDKTAWLVDMVCQKGDVASALMMSILEQKDENLAKHLHFLQN